MEKIGLDVHACLSKLSDSEEQLLSGEAEDPNYPFESANKSIASEGIASDGIATGQMRSDPLGVRAVESVLSLVPPDCALSLPRGLVVGEGL